MKKRKNKKSPAKLKLERLQKFWKEFENEFNKVFEKSELYWDEVIVDWLTPFDLVVEWTAESFVKWFKYLNSHWILQEQPNFFDQYIYHLSWKHWILASCMFANVMARWLNIIEKKDIHKAQDFYEINFDNLTKKLKVKVARILKRNWEKIYWFN